MQVDARTLPAGTTIEADVCIVGAGAAGITLARGLRGRGYRVALLESGGVEPAMPTQDLYGGENVGRAYFPLDRCRTRWFGGSTNCWTGVCRPLDEVDFEARPGVPHSGWPFDREHLRPFYEEAQRLCRLGPFAYDGEAWADDQHPVLPLGPRVVTRMLQLSPPVKFGEAFRDDLFGADDVTVYLHANAVEIQLHRDGKAVQGLRLACLEGPRLMARARVYVLATGAIENARLLLASDGVARGGVGNGHDLVGRYFMEHPHTDVEGFVVPSRTDLRLGLYSLREVNGVRVLGYLTPAADVLRGEQLLSSTCVIQQAPASVADERAPLYTELHRVAHEMDRQGPPPPGAAVPQAWYFGNASEQAPNPDSRVTLGTERDALGMRRVRLDWRLGELDHRSLRRAHRLIAEELVRAGFGRLKMTLGPGPEMPASTHGGFHHMGTTRMHEDPAAGVVDPRCRVHGIGNLFVAGSSVFPTGGAANPTLTIVALALRLAAHLREELR